MRLFKTERLSSDFLRFWTLNGLLNYPTTSENAETPCVTCPDVFLVSTTILPAFNDFESFRNCPSPTEMLKKYSYLILSVETDLQQICYYGK